MVDERIKKIDELDKHRKESRAEFVRLMEGLGESLLTRPINDADLPVQEIEEYRRLQKEIEAAQASIQTVEVQIARLRNLEEEIEAGEKKEHEQANTLNQHYAQLGGLVLEDAGYNDFTAPWQEQADMLSTKLKSLNERMAELAEKKGNVFTWIGKNAQGMVLKSFQANAQENYDRLCRNVGEQFTGVQAGRGKKGQSSNFEITELIDEIGKNKDAARTLGSELSALREERRRVSETVNAEGGPLKQMKKLRKHIEAAKEELLTLYRNFGTAAYNENAGPQDIKTEDVESPDERSTAIKSLLNKADKAILKDAGRLMQSIFNDEAKIKKLETSLKIDENLEKIEKMRRSIVHEKARISELERAIEDLESRIKDAENQNKELQKFL